MGGSFFDIRSSLVTFRQEGPTKEHEIREQTVHQKRRRSRNAFIVGGGHLAEASCGIFGKFRGDALFNDVASVQNEDPVEVQDRVEPVSDT